MLHADDNLYHTLDTFASSDMSNLPVVESPESMKLVGVVRHRDAIILYNQALIRLRRQQRGET